MDGDSVRESRVTRIRRLAAWRGLSGVGPPARGYFPSLDGLRALAVGVVMMSHILASLASAVEKPVSYCSLPCLDS